MTNLTIGQTIADYSEWNDLPVGATVTDRHGWIYTKVRDYDPNPYASQRGVPTSTYLDPESGERGDFYQPWNYGAVLASLPELGEVEDPEAPTPARPKIDFSLGRFDTARAYAEAANSRVLDPRHRDLLSQVAAGHEVDAYDLNEALTAAMRACVTRDGQSSSRRERAKKVAHLAHIVQAVLANHADDLPAYAVGERSRKVQELRGEISTLTQAASDERRRLVGEIEALKVRIGNLIDENVEQAIEVGILAGTLAYAMERLSPEDQLRVAGFREGIARGITA